MNELFVVCYEQDILCSEFFSLYNFSFTHTEEQYKVHNAFISLEYLVKIVRKLMQQMFECFDNFKKYKKKLTLHIYAIAFQFILCTTNIYREIFVSFYSLYIHYSIVKLMECTTLPIGYSFY